MRSGSRESWGLYIISKKWYWTAYEKLIRAIYNSKGVRGTEVQYKKYETGDYEICNSLDDKTLFRLNNKSIFGRPARK